MLKLIVPLVLLATHVYCQIKPCCYPDQWEATEGFISGSVDDEGHYAIILGNIVLAVDADNKRVHAIESLIIGNETKTYTVLQLYQQKVQYVIEKTTCTKSTLGPWNNLNCIPDTANLVRQYRIGLNESVQLADFTWNGDTGVQLVSTVTVGTCIPVSLQFYGKVKGEQFMNSAGFIGPTLGIKDPHIFDIPAICKGPGVIDSTLPARGSVHFTR